MKTASLIALCFAGSTAFSVALASHVFSATDLVIATQTSHSGGTDKDGCHTDSKTGERHCHEKEGDKKE